MIRAIGITGASGYIGQAILPLARAKGWHTVAIGRRPASGAEEFRHADLAQPLAADAVRGLDAVIHLAADTGGSQVPGGSELAFAVSLANACRDAGIPLLVVSSQAASAAAPSAYGRTKAAIEQAVRPLGAIVLRPGLVVGGRDAGLFGLLVTLVRHSPIVPRLLPVPAVQPVHVDDLAAAMLAAVTDPGLAGQCISVSGEPIGFDELLMQIAHHRLHRRRFRLPVPTRMLRLALEVAGRILGPRLSPERLDSLTNLPALDSRPDLQRLRIELRPLPEALDRRASARRVLLHEARMLARAAIARPHSGLMRRYARLLPLLGVHQAMDIPTPLLMSPTALAALDSPARRRAARPGDLSWRTEVVSRLAEADAAWADRYLPRPGHSGLFRAGLSFARAGWLELQVRLVAPWALRMRGTK